MGLFYNKALKWLISSSGFARELAWESDSSGGSDDNEQNGRRSEQELDDVILEVVLRLRRASLYKIIMTARMNRKNAQEYVDKLVEYQLLNVEKPGRFKIYSLTSKGREVVELYRKIEEAYRKKY